MMLVFGKNCLIVAKYLIGFLLGLVIRICRFLRGQLDEVLGSQYHKT